MGSKQQDLARGIFEMGVYKIKHNDKQGTLYVKLSKQATHKIDPTRTVSVQQLLDQQSPSSNSGRKDSSLANHTKYGGAATQKRINTLIYGVNAEEFEWQEEDEISWSWRAIEKLKMGLKIILVVIVSVGFFRLIEIQKSINQ
ncbi:unnamed protein product [Cuscuta europaea]|uniref:Uncharacterized protein n=1 Tax=Cuscuta europaea TaxID=41803 RepID=A0A9P0YX55_CUSEU|nr:unnamed protein product [Cuscuta europaea]